MVQNPFKWDLIIRYAKKTFIPQVPDRKVLLFTHPRSSQKLLLSNNRKFRLIIFWKIEIFYQHINLLIKYFHMIFQQKNGTLLSVIYVILLIILIVKDVNQTSSIFCNSNLSSKNQEKNVNLPIRKCSHPWEKKNLVAASPPRRHFCDT